MEKRRSEKEHQLVAVCFSRRQLVGAFEAAQSRLGYWGVFLSLPNTKLCSR